MSRLESDYYAFMDFGGEHAREALSHYVPFFRSGPVLELGSGSGEFLGLLTEAGIASRGVDLDEGMVARSREAGHDVVLGDAVEHLEKTEVGSLGGVFCAHFLEHLQPDGVARVYGAAARALRAGGVFVAAVPNAGSLSVLSYDFWRDPTHVRFYDPALLAFFAGTAGLTVVASGANPRNDPGPPPQLVPPEEQSLPPLTEAVSGLRDAALAAYPDGEDGRGELWLRLVHLLTVLDDRAQVLQHHNGELHRSYQALLSQLYPPNEVYVVAETAEQ